ncbi:MAG: nucleotidyltransferase domain-containing protein [Alphaproteobacteria bacterium]|nr:nucleotidyltransferase domain-containing protein [Alphaproteobacteria bacterium]
MTGTIDEAVDRIVNAVNPEAVYLFGSRARGTAEDGSDWDLFVVMNDAMRPGEVTPSKLRRLLTGLGMAFDVVPCRKSVFEQKKSDINSLSHDVVAEGVLLYERQRSDRLD